MSRLREPPQSGSHFHTQHTKPPQTPLSAASRAAARSQPQFLKLVVLALLAITVPVSTLLMRATLSRKRRMDEPATGALDERVLLEE